MNWETVMGLEVHAELLTKTKIFCGCSTAFGSKANTQICEICTGMPGTLPVLNQNVLLYAIKAGIALNCEITRHTQFDRKNYFYPDLPKAYQISQLYLPICRNGFVDIETKNGKKRIGIHEIHMEEDAGKLVHSETENKSYIDFNRCGIPLIEIVSQADFTNADEVIAYVEKLRSILKYIGVCDCKMQEGSLRVDVNLSVKPQGSQMLGTRTEMKNLNSFHDIRRSIEYEQKRQIELLENGECVLQQTRRWDAAKGISVAMRTKEEAEDYKYFPEPDIPAIDITDGFLRKISASLPELPDEKKQRYMSKFGLSEYDTQLILSEVSLSEFFEETAEICGEYKETANWITGELLRLLKEHSISPDNIPVSPQALSKIIEMLFEQKINRTVAKEAFEAAFTEKAEPEQYIKDHNLLLFTDSEEMTTIIKRVIAENEKSVSDYKAGKLSAFGYITGQAMKALCGKASAKQVQKILKELLD